MICQSLAQKPPDCGQITTCIGFGSLGRRRGDPLSIWFTDSLFVILATHSSCQLGVLDSGIRHACQTADMGRGGTVEDSERASMNPAGLHDPRGCCMYRTKETRPADVKVFSSLTSNSNRSRITRNSSSPSLRPARIQ